MKFSKSTELAIHGLWMLARKRPDLLLVSEMADAQGVSQSYLAKVFQRLARSGLVRSTRGKRGGFKLARTPDTISLEDVVRAMETREPLYECVDTSRRCAGRPGCPLRGAFSEAEQSLFAALQKTSLADLLRRAEVTERSAWLSA